MGPPAFKSATFVDLPDLPEIMPGEIASGGLVTPPESAPAS